MTLPQIETEKISGKRGFVRCDFDVPLKEGNVQDETRLTDIWPTIQKLLDANCHLVLAGHLGRPQGKVDPELSVVPIAQWIAKKLSLDPSLIKPTKIGLFDGFEVSEEISVLENLRFDPREESNDPDYAKELAGLADFYVNESFACSEREHASIVGVPKHLPHFAGLRLTQEIDVLTKLFQDPQRPMVAIIGGAKLETKLPVISKMGQVADSVIVGGKLLEETDQEQFSDKVHLLRLTADRKDVVQTSVDGIGSMIELAKTIVWNGPLGMVEDFTYQVGTRRLAELIASNNQAFKIVGGGDTVGFVDKLGLTNKFSWVCSGGGSMLKVLAGEKLPGVEALEN